MHSHRYLQALIDEGEHCQQDFKYKVTDAVKLARSVSAFANTAGGRLLIGVRDDGVVAGVRLEEEIFMMHAAAYKYCTPPSAISFETLHVNGRTIVIATVPKCLHKPVYAIEPASVTDNTTNNQGTRKRAYIRIADENIVATPVHLEIWRQENSPVGTITTYSDDERALLSILSAHSPLSLNRFVRLSRVQRRRAIAIIAKLVRFGLCRMDFTDHKFLFSIT